MSSDQAPTSNNQPKNIWWKPSGKSVAIALAIVIIVILGDVAPVYWTTLT